MKNQQSLNATNSYDPRLDQLARVCVDRLDDLLEKLEVNLQASGTKYVGNCPIHGNSDSSSFNIYRDGYAVPGYWKCYTKLCEKVFKPTIIGFARGRLSNLELDYHWADRPKAIYPFDKTIDYLCGFAKVKLDNIKVDPRAEERRRFLLECKSMEEDEEKPTIHRSVVQKNLIIPADYFIRRGFSKEVLNQFDIGLSKRPKPTTSNRVIVPIYNENEYIIGYTARSVFEKCKTCKMFHDPQTVCPSTETEKGLCSKWRNFDFNAESTLYNYWMAKPAIKKEGSVILVEGPGDVWKLCQNGYKNVVGMFGNTLRSKQEKLLSKIGTMVLIVMTDTDEAGLEGAKLIKKNFGRLYRLHFPRLDGLGKDIGDLNDDVVTEKIKPMIDGIMKFYE